MSLTSDANAVRKEVDPVENTLKSLEELVEEELKKIVKKGDLSPVELENATKALCLLEKIQEYNGNSMYPESYGMPAYSERRSRSPVTGRYISTGHYSGHSINDRMIAKLEEMYDSAGSEHEREVLDKWIKRLETER